jgi:hypothetical protein
VHNNTKTAPQNNEKEEHSTNHFAAAVGWCEVVIESSKVCFQVIFQFLCGFQVVFGFQDVCSDFRTGFL